MKRVVLLALVALMVLSAVANAALLYEQVTLETTDRGAYQHFGQQLADDFVPLVTDAVGTVTWRGSYYGADNPGATESFTVQLFADNAGLPADTPLFEVVGPASMVAVGDLLGKTLYEYSMTVAGPSLNAGTTYWISMYTKDSPGNYAWANSTDGTPDGAIRTSGGAWQNFDSQGGANVRSNHVFSLNSIDAPPVPALGHTLLLLLGTGLAALGVRSLRRRTDGACS